MLRTHGNAVLAAAAGCAAAVFLGEVVPQLKNLVKHGHIEEASDIALGATIDCIVGAIPAGKWGQGFAKKALEKVGPKIKEVIRAVIARLYG
jgi:hypothetical protein